MTHSQLPSSRRESNCSGTQRGLSALAFHAGRRLFGVAILILFTYPPVFFLFGIPILVSKFGF
jgi:hypothetical protein